LEPDPILDLVLHCSSSMGFAGLLATKKVTEFRGLRRRESGPFPSPRLTVVCLPRHLHGWTRSLSHLQRILAGLL